jgi:uncharacterized membrane protein
MQTTEVTGSGSVGDGPLFARRPRAESARRGPPAAGERDDDGVLDALTNALGWFSIGLGVVQIVAPERVARLIGVRPSARAREVLRAIGAREIATGVGILAEHGHPRWLWGRMAGDLVDLALLGSTLVSRSAGRGRTAGTTAAVLGVAALDALTGAKLSRRSPPDHGIAEPLPGLHVRKTVTVKRPVEEVYGFWRDFENLPRFLGHLESVRTTGPLRSRWTARGAVGAGIEWEAEVVEDRPGELIAWHSLEGADVLNAGTVRFSPAPGDRGTEVRVDLRYEFPGGPVGAAFAKLFRLEPAQQLGEELRAFKQVMETGEVLVSDATLRRGPRPAMPPAAHPDL